MSLLNCKKLIINNAERNIITTGLFCASTCIVSVFFTQITSVIAITGGIGSVNLCYLIPCKIQSFITV